ncbi:MAG: RHS repeat-associated core domain-containing protein, partial [Solirubrobacteraceae bacterium]
TSVSAFLFNGKEKDLETSLYYYGARYYNPKISNWLSVDAPLINGHYLNGNHDGGVFNSYNLSAYGYCRQNPVIYIDPDGNQIRPVGTGWFKMTHTENFLKNSHLNIDVKGNKVPTILPKFEAKDFNLNAGGYNKPGISATPKEIKNPFQGNGFDPNPQMGDTPDTPSDARGNMRNTSSIDKGMGLVEGIKQLFQLKDNVSDVLNASKAIDFDKAMGVGREQASDFGKAIDITNKYDLSGQFKADVTNYIFDGSLPEGNKGMQNSSIISTGTQILKANNLPVRSESQNLNR